MKHGFIKVAACTPKIKVADTAYNTERIIEMALDATKCGAKVVVFPELVISGYTCQDLFLQERLIDGSLESLEKICNRTLQCDAVIFVGMALVHDSKLYNVAVAICHGEILAVIPKKNLPNYGEYYEARHFCPGENEVKYIEVCGQYVPFGMNIILKETDCGLPLRISAELCEDLWTMDPPSTMHALAGATMIVNLSASNEVVCKDIYRRKLVEMTSARLVSAYVYSSAGEGESSQDLVFGGHNIIAENGSTLAQSKLFETGTIYADVDLFKLEGERRRITTYPGSDNSDYVTVEFALEKCETHLNRYFAPNPFVPSDEAGRRERCEEILTIQALGLKKRLEHTGVKDAVIGLSGGLDSTLALLVIARAFDMAGLDHIGIHCITMPCFGTTDRTYDNACTLASSIGATLKEIRLEEAVRLHFRDIGHEETVRNVTYENCQARERTQVLMDIANLVGGLVIGTGDMSELALGWATYNGDHMSMYGVNGGVPKTLVRHLVRYYADTCNDETLAKVLLDVLDTPVSPELLPPLEGEIAQKTEDIVGPYELHDFFMYYVLRFGFGPEKIFRIACMAFEGVYEKEMIFKWENNFYRRFFAQQFKRSCLPDGPKVGSVAVSPRGDLRMPSDASRNLWMAELDTIKF